MIPAIGPLVEFLLMSLRETPSSAVLRDSAEQYSTQIKLEAEKQEKAFKAERIAELAVDLLNRYFCETKASHPETTEEVGKKAVDLAAYVVNRAAWKVSNEGKD